MPVRVIFLQKAAHITPPPFDRLNFEIEFPLLGLMPISQSSTARARHLSTELRHLHIAAALNALVANVMQKTSRAPKYVLKVALLFNLASFYFGIPYTMLCCARFQAYLFKAASTILQPTWNMAERYCWRMRIMTTTTLS